jgi:hypothetical protein
LLRGLQKQLAEASDHVNSRMKRVIRSEEMHFTYLGYRERKVKDLRIIGDIMQFTFHPEVKVIAPLSAASV